MDVQFTAAKPNLPGNYWFRSKPGDGVLINIIADDQNVLRAAAMLPDQFHLRPVILLDSLEGEWSESVTIEQPAEQAPDAPAEPEQPAPAVEEPAAEPQP